MDNPVKVNKRVERIKENGKKKPEWHENFRIIPAIIMKQQNLKQ